VIAWWRRLLRGRALERELDAELRDHVERHAADLVRSGVSPEDARRQSLMTLGGLEQAKEDCRQARGTMLVEQAGRDIVFALRQLRRQPAFWATLILTLVLGVAASTSMFAIVNGVLLRPLPFADPDRLVGISNVGYRGVYLELREHSQTMDLGGFAPAAATSLTHRGEPVRLRAALADARLFDVLGVPPALGRRFLPEDVRPGAAPVVVLNHGLWQRQFGGERTILDQQITLEGIPRTVIGVMPADFRFLPVDVWIPLIISPANTPATTADLWANSANMVGRLRQGVRLEQADQEVRVIVPPLRERFPWSMPADFGRNAAAVPLLDQIVGDVRPTLLILLASVVAVLLILCVNVANLLLTRGLSRERELAVRAAVGATRTRLIQQLVIESLTVAVISCVLGVAASVALLRATLTLLPADVPRVADITIDGMVLAFALGVSVVTGLLFGVLPALHASRSSTRLALGAARSAALHLPERRASRVLATAEFALAVMLVASAALLGRSLVNLLAVDPGFSAEQLVTANIAPPRQRYATPPPLPQLAPAYYQFVDALLERVGAAPGVRSVAAGFAAPFAGQQFGSVFAIEGRPDPATKAGDWAMADVRTPITPDFHRVLGVTVLEGRPFSNVDRADTERVAIVSRSLAHAYWGTASPVGQRIRFPGGRDAPWVRIVGVAGDIKWNNLGEERTFSGDRATGFLRTVYIPFAQNAFFNPNGVQLIVRTGADPEQLAANLRSIVRSLDRDTPVSDIRSGEAGIAESLARPRFTAFLVSAFAAMALLLGAIGVYGVLAYAVGRRTQEFAVRLALGADASAVLRGVLGEGARLTVVGVAVGLAGAFLATRALSRLLFGVAPTDPVTFGAVALILLVVGLLASYIPARRAMRVDPVAALQAE
jgi:putative ABC transport system permease protein